MPWIRVESVEHPMAKIKRKYTKTNDDVGNEHGNLQSNELH